ncbi:hypothetical protein WJX72_000253 [[Myrmecia] bisecta]|uniref:Actin-related protein 2/3 complex subunit 3 n=1 Tax=[Myrmecia] bisecta TaxID=41462 RepID=A0AAW1P657_9CHLO
MVYHSALGADCRVVCGCAILPVSGRARGPAPLQTSEEPDIVEEAINLCRANILFRTFDVQSPADKLLIYLTLFINLCLKRLSESKASPQQAEKQLFSLAHDEFSLPGEPGFVLGGLMSAPANKAEEDLVRGYLRQCREEAGRRLIKRCYRADGTPDKFWMAFGNRRFLNKTLT